jgi:hypothetical protein
MLRPGASGARLAYRGHGAGSDRRCTDSQGSLRMLAYHLCETPLVERTAGAFVAHSVSVGGSLMGQLALSGIASQTNRRTKSRQRRSETRGVRQELRHANWLVGEVSASARLVSLLRLRLRDRSAVGNRRDRHVSGGKQRRLHPSPGGVHGGAGDVGGVRG